MNFDLRGAAGARISARAARAAGAAGATISARAARAFRNRGLINWSGRFKSLASRRSVSTPPSPVAAQAARAAQAPPQAPPLSPTPASPPASPASPPQAPPLSPTSAEASPAKVLCKKLKLLEPSKILTRLLVVLSIASFVLVFASSKGNQIVTKAMDIGNLILSALCVLSARKAKGKKQKIMLYLLVIYCLDCLRQLINSFHPFWFDSLKTINISVASLAVLTSIGAIICACRRDGVSTSTERYNVLLTYAAACVLLFTILSESLKGKTKLKAMEALLAASNIGFWFSSYKVAQSS